MDKSQAKAFTLSLIKLINGRTETYGSINDQTDLLDRLEDIKHDIQDYQRMLDDIEEAIEALED